MTKTKKGTGATVAQDEPGTGATTKTKTKNKGGDADEAAAAAAAVVLRMELHCNGCALKVRKAIKGAQGAESVRTDVAAGTVTVAGKADPWDIRDRIQVRMARRNKPAIDIAFVSPANPPRPPPKPKEQKQWWWSWSINKNKDDGGANNNKQGKGRHDKQTPPPESTVVLSIQLHCKGCNDRIKRKASKIKGVKQVTIDTAKEQVTVKGTMDAKALPDILSAKLKRRVTAVVVPPTANKNKDKKAAKHDDNRDGEQEAGGDGTSTTAGDAKKKNKNCKQQRGEAAAAGDDHDYEKASWMSAEQQYQASYGRGGSVGPSYRVELLQAFSDENPNACSIM